MTAVEHEQKSHIEIATTMNTSPGFKGLLERFIVPILNPRVYRKELKLLEAVYRRVRAPARGRPYHDDGLTHPNRVMVGA